MKICWDNLENLKYIGNGTWRKETHYYIYKENCNYCKEPFLADKHGRKKCCSISCFKKRYKTHSKKTKKKMSESQKGKIGKKNSSWKGGGKYAFYNTYAPQINWCEKVRRNKINKNILEVKCTYCGKWFIPNMMSVANRIQSLNSNHTGEKRLYCSEGCKQECPTYHKQKWPEGFKQATSREVQPELRQMVLKRDNYTCQKCNKHQNELKTGLHCHHLEGIRWEPLESANMDKCITLCKECHKLVHKLPDCGYYDLRCNGGN